MCDQRHSVQLQEYTPHRELVVEAHASLWAFRRSLEGLAGLRCKEDQGDQQRQQSAE